MESIRSGIRMTADMLQSVGFKVNVVAERGALCEASLTYGDLYLDFKVVDPSNIAFVTSNALYRPEKAGTKESNATIINGRDEIRSDLALRTVISGKVASRRQAVPTFVELFRNDLTVDMTILRAVLGLLRTAAKEDKKLLEPLQQLKDSLKA